MGSTEITVLVAEDDDGHAELITGGLKDSGINNRILRFSDGKEVWDFLSKGSDATETPGETKMVRSADTAAKTDSRQSFLLLLDINMPGMDGIEVLRLIKGHRSLNQLPVIMLTTTDDPVEIERCYRLGCNLYITKPVDFEKFEETLRLLGKFIQIARTPKLVTGSR